MSEKSSIAALGDADTVFAFKAVGADAYPVANEAEAREKLRLLARNYDIIFIIEQFAEKEGLTAHANSIRVRFE